MSDPGPLSRSPEGTPGAAAWIHVFHSRYDGYGQDLADTPQVGKDAGARNPFRFRGALDLGTGTGPLYEMGARFYAPSMGAWISMDTYAGSAQDPASLNRFLYVQGNPTTLVDPTGHKGEGCGTILTNDACTAISNANRQRAQEKEEKEEADDKKDDEPADKDDPRDPDPADPPTVVAPPVTPVPTVDLNNVNTAGLCAQVSATFLPEGGQGMLCEVKDRDGNRAILVVAGGGLAVGSTGASAGITGYVSNGMVNDQEGDFSFRGASAAYLLGGSFDYADSDDGKIWAADAGVVIAPPKPGGETHPGLNRSRTWIVPIPRDAPDLVEVRLPGPLGFFPITARGFADGVFRVTDR